MSAPKFVLYGPPATRKSTLVRMIPTIAGAACAIDVEHVGPDEVARKRFVETIARVEFSVPLFLGAADVWQFPKTVKVVRLLPPTLEGYLAYVAGRNEQFPHKANQSEEKHYKNFAALDASQFLCTIDPTVPELASDGSFTRHFLRVLGIPTRN